MGKVKKYLIVSPHSDDALLSCAHILFSPDYDVHVLTVENDPRRISEDEKLYDFLNIPFHHLTVDFHDESYYGFNKTYKEVTPETANEYLQQYFGGNVLNKIETALISWLQNFLRDNKECQIIAPWGIGHPFHMFVKEVVEKVVNNADYYREFPHSYKKRSQFQVQKQLNEYTLKRSVPVENFHEVKWKLASKFYRTQSGLLFFEQNNIKKMYPEEIYQRKVK